MKTIVKLYRFKPLEYFCGEYIICAENKEYALSSLIKYISNGKTDLVWTQEEVAIWQSIIDTDHLPFGYILEEYSPGQVLEF